jgi:hypothetical protein
MSGSYREAGDGDWVYPMAVGEDGVAVTGFAVDSAGVIEAFYWSRRESPTDGT